MQNSDVLPTQAVLDLVIAEVSYRSTYDEDWKSLMMKNNNTLCDMRLSISDRHHTKTMDDRSMPLKWLEASLKYRSNS
jgi:hypothetical protein